MTSSAGAAVHDILRILRKRYPLTKVRLFPVRVQGAEAPQEIAAAIAYANQYQLADLLIVGRGGGSIEDLWAFNDEGVAQAIYDSRIPVISAVGHEPDVTIADFVADLRAATPSNGAELAVPDCEALYQRLDSISAAMETALLRQLKSVRRHLNMLAASPAIQSPYGYLNQRRKSLQLLQTRLCAGQESTLQRQKQRFVTFTAKLDAMSPLKVLSRGYSVTHTGQGEIVRSVKEVERGQTLNIRLRDGFICASVEQAKENDYEPGE